MNEIVSIKNKNLLDGYKLVYPTNNKDLKVNILDDNSERQLHIGISNLDLSMLEEVLYFNKLFISKYSKLLLEHHIESFSYGVTLVFTSKDGKEIKAFPIKSLKITDSHGVEVDFTHLELIKEIYFNSGTGAIIIVVDEKFCSSKEKKYIKEQKVKNHEKARKEQKEKALLNSIEDLLN